MDKIKEAGDMLHSGLQTKNKEDAVLDVITNNNLEERIQICNYYTERYNTDLYDELKDKLSGHFKEVAIHLFLDPITFIAKMLKKGLKGFAADESIVYETLTSHNQEELRKIEQAYLEETGRELKKDIEKNFSGIMKKNLLNLLYTPRSENKNPDKVHCEKQAQLLIDVGESSWVNDENIFKEVFITNSPEELIMISRYYLEKTGNNILDVIEKKFSGKNKTILREVLYNNITPYELFAEKIYLACKGLGTNDSLLCRVLVERSSIDMPEIRSCYKIKYNTSMRKDIVGDTSGIYQEICEYLSQL